MDCGKAAQSTPTGSTHRHLCDLCDSEFRIPRCVYVSREAEERAQASEFFVERTPERTVARWA